MEHKSKRHKITDHSFQAAIKEDRLIIKNFIGNRKVHEEVHGLDFIEEYLNKETLYQRRQFIFDKNINNLKSDLFRATSFAIEGNLDAINDAIIEVLKISGLYRRTFQERVEKVIKCNTSHKSKA